MKIGRFSCLYDFYRVCEFDCLLLKQRAVYRWILDPEDRDAVLAHVALRKPNEDFAVLVEFSCIYSPEEFLAVRRAYQHRYKRSLEEDVAANTHDDFRKVRNFSLIHFVYSIVHRSRFP